VIEREGLLGVLPEEHSDDGTFCLFDHDADNSLDICDEIAVVMEAGAEKHCYVGGWAVAINSKGERAQVTLHDIYALAAKKFGVEPTAASY